MQVISLITDFGLSDWFVGTMKGVIARLAPAARVIDLTHDVPHGDIRGAAFALRAGYHFFPKGTIHVAVVDPGVGSARQALAVQTSNYFFVGPDNGVLSFALRREKVIAIRLLKKANYFLQAVSHTFHGRDIFAPVAAHLSRGIPIRRLGPPANDFVRLSWPEPVRHNTKIEGEIAYLDRFGNGITNLPAELINPLRATKCIVHSRGRLICPLKPFYQAVPLKRPVAVVGSSGFLEIGVNGGSAKQSLGLRIGTRVTL
jgi:S-adenosylmethionine hydrolase